MKKIKQKLINVKKYKSLLKESNSNINELKNEYMITESYYSIRPSSKNEFGKTQNNFDSNNNINYESKSEQFRKLMYMNNSGKQNVPNKIKLNLKVFKNNKSTLNAYTHKDILPFLGSGFMYNPYKLDNNKIITYSKYPKSSRKSSIKNKILKKSSKNNDEEDIENRNKEPLKTHYTSFKKENILRNDITYKYSSIIKSLDTWDKDHCIGSINKSDINLFNYLNNYFKKNNLINDHKNLIFASNILKSRKINQNLDDDGKQNSKLLIEMLKLRRIETGTILKNNLYKTQMKFNELFNKKYYKEFEENLDIDPDTFNLLIEDEKKNVFYYNVIKDRIKYENQLHDEILKINNIIIDKKKSKNQKTLKLKELYKDMNAIKKEYNEKYNKNRKTYWSKYDSCEHYYNNLISNLNVKISAISNKEEENKDDVIIINKKFLRAKTTFFENDRKLIKSPSPFKKRKKYFDIEQKNIKELKQQIIDLENVKKLRLLQMDNEMNSKLKLIYDNYIKKSDTTNEKQKTLEDELKINKLELEYYKKINDELIKEHKLYYMDKLKKGYDCRKEGIMWIVANLMELQVPLEYHHFPKYLTHEQIDYLKKNANIILKQREIKIIIDVLKKKQNTQSMNDIIKCMDAIDNVTEVGNIKKGIVRNNPVDLKNNDFIISKNKIDKKFIKIYKDNFDIMKSYFLKNAESYEFYNVINEFKKDLYHGTNSDFNKNKRDILNVFMGEKKNKNFIEFLLELKSNYDYLEKEKDRLFQIQKENYLKLVENAKNRKATINTVVKNEMIKRCLFGTKLDN